MIGGKMVGTVLALMIADIKRVSQHFQGFKSADMSEIPQVLTLQILVEYIRNKDRLKKKQSLPTLLPIY
jgi:hypothetical protein